MFPLLVSCLG
uniref:Uncharacterized protein n=1 Tax=Anguilla anguilla TaxID=7936 RepID=A0A0E9VGP0_ANGAN